MKKFLQFLILTLLISLTNCQSNTDNKSDTRKPEVVEQKDTLDRPSKACIDRSSWYQYTYKEDDFPGEQMENFNPDTIKKYGFKHVEITSSLYGVTRQLYFDTNGRVGLIKHTGNSPFYPSSTIQSTYIRKFTGDDLDKINFSNSRSFKIKRKKSLQGIDTSSIIYKKSVSFQWPIGTEIIQNKNGWYRRSYIDSVLVYEGVVTVSRNCDTIVSKDYRKGNIDIPFGQDLVHYYTEHFIFENDILKHYKFVATEASLTLESNNWPRTLEEEYTYSSGRLLKKIIRKIVNDSGELNETIYYKYSTSLP